MPTAAREGVGSRRASEAVDVVRLVRQGTLKRMLEQTITPSWEICHGLLGFDLLAGTVQPQTPSLGKEAPSKLVALFMTPVILDTQLGSA